MLWPTININKPRARRLRIGRVRSRAVCWLLKQARAAVDENEEATSSNRPRHEKARHMPSAAMASRATTRADRRQPPTAATQRKEDRAPFAVRLIRGTAPKGAKIFAVSDMTSRCEAQSSRLVPSRTTRHLQRASRSGHISRTGSSKTTSAVLITVLHAGSTSLLDRRELRCAGSSLR